MGLKERFLFGLKPRPFLPLLFSILGFRFICIGFEAWQTLTLRSLSKYKQVLAQVSTRS